MSNPACTLRFTLKAKQQLAKLDKSAAEQIARKLIWLAENADDIQHEALTGEFSRLYRYRIGNYRALYSLDNQERVIEVVKIGHRRDVYKD